MTAGTAERGWFWRNLNLALRDGGWVLFTAALLAALVGTAATVAAPLVARQVIDSLSTTGRAAPALAGPVALLLAMAAIRLVAGYLRRRYASRVSLRVEYDLRREMFAVSQRLGGAAGERLDTGQLLARSTSDLALEQELFGLLPLFVMNGALLLLAIGVMVTLSPLLTAVVLVVAPAIYLLTRHSQRVVFPAMWDAQNHLGKLTGIAQETVYGIGVVLGFGQDRRAAVSFDAQARTLYAARLRLARLAGRYLAGLQALPPLGQLGILALGGWLAMIGQISLGTFVAFAAYLVHIVSAARGYGVAVVAIQQGKASVLRIFEVLDAVPAIRDRPGAINPGRLSGSVELAGVSFHHTDHQPVLRDVQLAIRPGETMALVGASGSGKSTLGLLLARFHEVTAGAVRIGGHDVRDLRLSALRRQVGIAFEDAFLFAGTVRENIAYGDPDASDARIRAAATAAAADAFIQALPEGYDTVIGERGATLSGGQRQRIALARTLLTDASVLVLDDATSAVDPAIETEILRALTGDPAGRTTLLITNRPAVVRFADRVWVLDEGRVLDVGTDDELRARCPTYASLVRESDELIDAVPRVAGMLTRTADEGGPTSVMSRTAMQDAVDKPPTTAAILRRVAELPEARDVPRGEPRRIGARLSLPALVLAHRWLLLAAVGLVALDATIGLTQPILVRYAIDAAVVTGARGALLGAALAALAIVATGAVVTLGLTRVTWRAAEEVLYALRTRTFGQLLRLGVGYYEREPAGRALSRITVDVAAVSNFAQTGLAAIAVGAASMVGMLVVLIALDTGLSLGLLPVLAAVVVLTLVLRTRSHRFYTVARDQASHLAAYLQENLNGTRVVQGLNRNDRNLADYTQLSGAYRTSRFRALMQGALCFALTEALSTVAMALVLWLGARDVAAGTLSLGTLVAFLLYTELLFGPIQQISQSFDSLQQAVIAMRRLRELDSVPVTVAEPAEPAPVNVLSGRVELAGVRFRYPGTHRDAVHGVDLRLQPGETVALVGETGSGKSTLLKLIARFYDVTDGSVSVDGVDLRRLPTGDYRRRLGLVPQEPFLFAGTVRDNIAYGRPDATDGEIEAVATAIGVHTILCGLPDGYATQVGPQGRALSAGQRQLVALARAYLVDPDILLLDEATAALDPDTEAAYRAAVVVLRRRRTTVMIAHRLATVQHADRILVLRDGRLIESGRQDELVAAGGEYARLWQAYRPARTRREVPT